MGLGFSLTGLFGKVPFVSSSAVVYTFKDLSVSRSARWATHEIIGKKPKLEYIGPGLTEVSFNIQLNSSLGTPPLVALIMLKNMLEKKQPERLLIGPDYLGKFVIESIGEERKYHNNFGICVSAEVSITLKEAA
jgi:phage protein U